MRKKIVLVACVALLLPLWGCGENGESKKEPKKEPKRGGVKLRTKPLGVANLGTPNDLFLAMKKLHLDGNYRAMYHLISEESKKRMVDWKNNAIASPGFLNAFGVSVEKTRKMSMPDFYAKFAMDMPTDLSEEKTKQFREQWETWEVEKLEMGEDGKTATVKTKLKGHEIPIKMVLENGQWRL